MFHVISLYVLPKWPLDEYFDALHNNAFANETPLSE